jgi:Rrf2 family transcriptional regulator, cysteine metabolism repressor
MKLSTRVQYGLRMLCQLSLVFNKGPLQLSEISDREGISEKYLGQIMLTLRSSGLVQATRGSQGGYFLSRPPDKISVREVFQCLEGSVLELDKEELVSDPDGVTAKAAVGEVLKKLKGAMEETLDGMTLQDIASLQLQLRGFCDYAI